MPAQRLSGRLLAVLGALLLAFAAGEVFARLRFPSLSHRGFVHPGLGWASKEFMAFDPATDGAAEDELRILFLGDSYLAGGGLKGAARRFSTVLERTIADQVEVRVLASPGWGTDQELLAFLLKGQAWRPDVVVVAFCTNNDLQNIYCSKQSAKKPFFLLDGEGRLRLHDSEGAPVESFAAGDEVRDPFQSYLLDLVRITLRSGGEEPGAVPTPALAGAEGRAQGGGEEGVQRVDVRGNLVAETPIERLRSVWELQPELDWSPQLGLNEVNAYIHEDFELNAGQWRLEEALLASLRDHAAAAGARLVVMLVPTTIKARDLRFVVGNDLEHRFETPDGPFTLRSREPQERLRAICERLGVDFFDPSAAFIATCAEGGLEEEFWPMELDRHFAEPAHAFLGAELHRYLRGLGLVR